MRVESGPLNPYRCLDNHQFQDWLVSVHLAGRANMVSEGMDQLIQASLKPTSLASKLAKTVAASYGYVVPYDQIAQALYRRSDQAEIDAVSSLGRYVQQRLGEAPFYQAKGLGFGFGVEGFNLNLYKLPFVYSLWNKIGEFVSLQDLASSVYGDTSNLSLDLATHHLKQLKRDFQEGQIFAGIDKIKFKEMGWSYRMYEASGEENLDRIEARLKRQPFPDYLSTDFQDWLADHAQLMSQKWLNPAKHRQLDLRSSVSLSRFEGRMAELFGRFAGYIVPTEYLRDQLLGKSHPNRRAEIIQSHILRLRRKLKDPTDIFTAYELGYGFGVQELKVTGLALKVLSVLWHDFGRGYMIDDLAVHEYGEVDPVKRQSIKIALFQLRQVFEGSYYEIARITQSDQRALFFLSRGPDSD